MKNTTIGVDTSLNSPSSTFTVSTEETSGTGATVSLKQGNPLADLPEGTYYGFIHASNVQIDLARLLGNVLSHIDASVPNKEQNKAMKHLIRKQFDKTLLEIHEMAWPSSLLGTGQQKAVVAPAGYILEPQ